MRKEGWPKLEGDKKRDRAETSKEKVKRARSGRGPRLREELRLKERAETKGGGRGLNLEEERVNARFRGDLGLGEKQR